jgi:MFS family permease
MKITKLGFRKWLSFIIAGLVGQLAWAIENNYLNLYVFDCTADYKYIPIMVGASAAAATITTLFMGALSDRLGKRKAFISLGYILWGISIILFAFFDPNSNVTFVAHSAMMSGVMIIIMDCIMTFFGSTANDAAFNAFVTDNTDTTNRGKVESVLSILPLISLIVVVVAGGQLVDNKADTHWDIFFYIFGGLTILAGIVCIFLLPKDIKEPNKEEPYIKNIFYGFRPSVIKNNKMLYIVLVAFMLFNMAVQVFLPYFMVYIQQVLGIQGGDFTITLGVVLGVSCVVTVVFGLFMDKIGKNRIMIPALGVAIIGAIMMMFVSEQIGVMIGGTILMIGYMVSTAVLGAKIRDYTPEKQVGLFQGVRMIFAVLIPMVTGPYIGLGLSHINAQTYVNEYNQTVTRPNQFIFLGAAVVLLITIAPLIYMIIYEKKGKQNEVVDFE